LCEGKNLFVKYRYSLSIKERGVIIPSSEKFDLEERLGDLLKGR
jgi:hypothetical protein